MFDHGLLKIRPYSHIFAKIIRGQFLKGNGSDDIENCNSSLLFYVIFFNLFWILTHLYCLHGMFVKIKTFCIKVFLLTNQKKTMGKNFSTKRSKTVVYKYKKKRRDERIEAGKH